MPPLWKSLAHRALKRSNTVYHFLPKFWNLQEMNEEYSYIFYTFFKNLQEMKEKPPWYHFEIYHMYEVPDIPLNWKWTCSKSHIGKFTHHKWLIFL